jgi:arsenate reductase
VITIYHNPRCSKSRATLKLLEDRGIQPRIVEYLKAPPTETELKQILKLLGLSAHDLARRSEPEYAQAHLDTATEAEILRAMVAHPILIERPIVVAGNKAAIGRPPENVLAIL